METYIRDTGTVNAEVDTPKLTRPSWKFPPSSPDASKPQSLLSAVAALALKSGARSARISLASIRRCRPIRRA
jgi:hypothetical protein